MDKKFGAVLFLAISLVLPSVAVAADRTLDCSTGTINAFLPRLRPGDTLFVTGTCNENITVTQENVTLDGQGVAVINGTDPNSHTVTIVSRRVDIIGFTITGGNHGIFLSRGAEATIDSNTIQGTGSRGVHITDGSSARITNNVIQNNVNNDGILVSESSTARIGINSGADTVASPNTISGNGGTGILLTRGASARIVGNTISGNTDGGIFIGDNSTADTGSNTIDSNGGHGIVVIRNSSVRLGRDSGASIFQTPNSTTVNNTGVGVWCRLDGVVDGKLGTLTGTFGATDIAGCTDSTIP